MPKMVPQSYIIAPQSKAMKSRTKVALVMPKYKTLFWKALSEYNPKTDVKLYTISREFKKWFVHYYGGTSPEGLRYYSDCHEAMREAARLMNMSLPEAKEVWKNLGLMPSGASIPISATHARKIRETVRKEASVPSDIHVAEGD